MPRRTIVKIDEDKCTGCGECVTACVEGALEIINGKAKLVRDSYCDGLGACMGHCPEDAIIIEEREADRFDEEAAKEHVARRANAEAKKPFMCPGSMARVIERDASPTTETSPGASRSELGQWPVQLTLVPPNAPYFQDADLVLTADCVPFAVSDFHSRFLRGRAVAVACPKLDDPGAHIDKLTQILTESSIRSLTVVHMEVPCCFGLKYIAEQALAASGEDIPVHDVTVSIHGEAEWEA